jgi:hypothetical protein
VDVILLFVRTWFFSIFSPSDHESSVPETRLD